MASKTVKLAGLPRRSLRYGSMKRAATACALTVVMCLLSIEPTAAAVDAVSGSGSWSSSTAGEAVEPPINASDSSNSAASGSGLNATTALVPDNETITFESLNLPVPQVTTALPTRLDTSDGSSSAAPLQHQIQATTAPIDTSAPDTVEIFQLQHAVAENSTTAPKTANTTSASESPSPSTSINLSTASNGSTSLSSASSSSGSNSTSDEETETPVVEIHGVPSPPTLVIAAAFDGGAEVSWQTPDDDGSDPILEYEVAWIDESESKVAGTKIVALSPGSVVIASGNSTTSVGTSPPPAVPTSVIISPLTNGRSYAFKVRAKNKNGYSTWSAKSLAVSPLHPPDLCGRVTCSGHGTCFPIYEQNPSVDRLLTETAASTDGQCICRPGYNPPDCSVKNIDTKFVWKVTEWGQCTSGCGGGQRTRDAICWDVALDQKAAADASCPEKKPSLTRICNGMECGSKLVSVRYEVETSYDEVLFSPEAWDAFEGAFTTEVAAALQMPRTRIEVTAIKRGSIVVFFQILPASRVGEQSLNDIVERLQLELTNASSTLRTRGTFARRVETNGVKLGFSIADQTVAGGAEDISVAGLIGTVLVLCSFVAMFGWFLRKRHERLTGYRSVKDNEKRAQTVLRAKRADLKPMGIRTMA